MLTLAFLGVGSAFAKRNVQSNALLEVWSQAPQLQNTPDEALLIDFGGTGPLALHQLSSVSGFSYLSLGGGINYRALRGVFVTHLHADHIGGLEELAMMSVRRARSSPAATVTRPLLISGSDVLSDLWEHSLQGGLGILDGRRAALSDYFAPVPIDVTMGSAAEPFVLGGHYELLPFRTDHIRLQCKYDWPSYGLEFRDRETGQSAVYSGDTRFDRDAILPRLSRAATAFHDVQLEEDPAAVHAQLSELRTLPAEVRRHVHLYHYGDRWDDPSFASVAAEFAGFARPQVRYSLFPS